MHRFLLIALLLAGNAFADELGQPTGEVLLTISGNITISNSEAGAEFDLQMLEKLGATSITTDSPWTDHATTFTGVKLSVLLNAVGAQSATFRAVALDNYWYEVIADDMEKYPIVVAYKRDGKYMNARTLGPLWIMYPFDDYPDLLTHENKASSVWQLTTMVVQ